MKTKKIVCKLLFIAVFTYSCSDEFLYQKDGYLIETFIYVFPDKDAETYPIFWANAGNATFTITKKPDWLKVESMTGKFQNGLAELTCSAVRNESFTAEFVYNATMFINVDGIGRCFVDVNYANYGSYPNHGDPIFFCGWLDGMEISQLDFGNLENYYSTIISNLGSGCLIWKVIECPKWINMETQQGTNIRAMAKELQITCERSGLPEGNHVGAIVFSTNDKNQSTYTITVRCQVGND